ncbi:MAG: substrate-binding domain-containing protein, partial [Casimicrobiaceae bacterium]
MTSAPAALRIFSGGAARGLVDALRETFTAQAGSAIEGSFGAVGAMKERLLADAPCDVVILTAALIEELTLGARLVQGTARPLGRVRTGIAVRADDALPRVAERASLADALCAAGAIYLPDPQRATAGIHFAAVLRKLGIDSEVAARLRPFPNGAAAMAALAQAQEPHAIGCTQVTEILYTPGVVLAGTLPRE